MTHWLILLVLYSTKLGKEAQHLREKHIADDSKADESMSRVKVLIYLHLV